MRVTQAFYHREGPFMVSPTILCGVLFRVPRKIRRGGALCTKSEKAEKLASNIYSMVVEAPRVAEHCLPGQFIIAKMDEEGERIPLTICDYDREEGTITIVFQPIGASTEKFATLKTGDAFEDFVMALWDVRLSSARMILRK